MKKTAYERGGRAGNKVIFSLIASMAILTTGAIVLAGIVLSGKLQEEWIPTVCMVMLFGATVMGTVIATTGEEGIWIPLAAFLAIQYLLLISFNIFAFGGGLERIGVGTLSVVMGAATALGLKFIPIARPRRTKYKRRFR